MGRGAIALALVTLTGGCLAAPGWEGPPGPHFDGRRFTNPVPTPDRGLAELLDWQTHRSAGPWRTHPEAQPGPPPPAEVPCGALRVTWVGHATALVQLDGVNVLTDPIWSDRASPVSFAGPRRVRPPGLRFEDLPRIDLVLVSHDHYDHCDLPTLRRLAERDHPVILAGLGNRALLEAHGVPGARELDWGSHVTVRGLTVHSVPARHSSGRSVDDRRRSLWTAFVLSGAGGPVYFAGDTAYGPHFRAARERFGPMRAALLPIGAYLPRWFMAPMHLDPTEAVRAAQDLQATTSVAIHFATFPLADDGEEQPPADLARALAAAPRPLDFRVPRFGEGIDLPPPPPADAAPPAR